MDTPAKVLSKAQQRKSLSSSRKKRKVLRPTLLNPYRIAWPKLNQEGKEELLAALQLSLEGLSALESSHDRSYKKKYLKLYMETKQQVWKEKGQERAEKKREGQKALHREVRSRLQAWQRELKQETVEQQVTRCGLSINVLREKRFMMVIGVNAVMRAIERDRLAGVIVDGSPTCAPLVTPIVPLCLSRKIPAIALPSLSHVMASSIHVGSCTALGLKRGVEKQGSPLHALYEAVSKCFKQQDLDPGYAISFVSPRVNEGHETEASGISEKDESQPTSDGERLDHLVKNRDSVNQEESKGFAYLHRGDSKQRVFVPRESVFVLGAPTSSCLKSSEKSKESLNSTKGVSIEFRSPTVVNVESGPKVKISKK
ncbi:unnamed protein product [Darwinula stevensoni]|uniref:Uncharacterized protein n=1 Tax=Darwinula stevensoni TaxID=69355 RepID=A0A7R8XE38_9CRUS|nr:unnamed protein product [Darwinula stevensoni]CAG0889190.1 unnamed protein product [Darwinula stevensoni]